MFDDLVPKKPPYATMTMDEVRAIEATSGIVVASTFSGCGGTCLGWRMAGADVRYALEYVPEARETYLANHPHVHMDARDIRDVKGSEVLAACGVDDLDVFEGSPPCASFSASGKRDKLWGVEKSYSTGKNQRTDDLVDEWVRVGLEIRPKVMVMENVAGLGTGAALTTHLHSAISTMTDAGYVVDARLLRGMDYGVPQVRGRLFIIAFRGDLGLAPRWPSAVGFVYTLRDALSLAGVSPPEELAAVDSARFAIAAEWAKLSHGESSLKYFNLVRPDPDEPCPTVTATHASPWAASVTHPDACRKFTPTELRPIFGVPRDFVLRGSVEQQSERLGRCVAPPVAKALAGEIIKLLKRRP